MKQIRLKESNQTLFVLRFGELAPEGSLFFLDDQWDWIMDLYHGSNDPEQRKEFMRSVLEKKKNDKHYNIFDDFPQELKEKNPKLLICEETIAMLRRGKLDNS